MATPLASSRQRHPRELLLGAQAGRVRAVDHPAFDADVNTIVGAVGARLTHVMLPKVGSVADIERSAAADWAPMPYQGQWHDRASFRYFWQVLERAYATGAPLPDSVRGEFS